MTSGEMLKADYWWRNVRMPVRFEAAIDTLIDEGFTRFIEVGPHAILGGYIRATAQKHQADVKIGRLMHLSGDWAGVRRQFADVMALAISTDAWPEAVRDRTLPRYPWNKKTVWATSTTESWKLFDNKPVHPLLGYPVPHAEHLWEQTVDLQLTPWLAGHEIDETVLFPAAGYLEMAIESARLSMKNVQTVELDNMAILRPMALSEESAKIVQTRVSPAGLLTLTSRDQLSAEEPLLHLAGRCIASDATKPQDEPWTARVEKEGCGCDVEAFYQALAEIGLTYKGAFTSRSISIRPSMPNIGSRVPLIARPLPAMMMLRRSPAWWLKLLAATNGRPTRRLKPKSCSIGSCSPMSVKPFVNMTRGFRKNSSSPKALHWRRSTIGAPCFRPNRRAGRF